MTLPTVLVLGHRFSSLAIESKILSKVATVVDGNPLAADQLAQTLDNASAVLLGTRARLDAAEINAMLRCRVIARYGVGLDNIDVEQATRRGIQVANVPDYCVDEVSDHSVALLLAASRRLFPAQAWLRAGKWGTMVMQGVARLSEQTVGIIGFGRIGQGAARKIGPFVRRVLAFDPLVAAEAIAKAGVEPFDLPGLFQQSDYVLLHCPLTPATSHLINRETLNQVKPNAWLVNTSRGELIDEAALVEALEARRLAGAALDVFSNEPLTPDSPLFKMENVILTPHVAWCSERATEDLQRLAAEQVLAVLEGRRPERLCNPCALETSSPLKEKSK